MKFNRYPICIFLMILFTVPFIGCHPRVDILSKAEKTFIRMVDKAAKQLDLNEEQKGQLDQLKMDIRKNFEEGRVKNKETLTKIKEEGMKENPDIGTMTSLLEGLFRDETQRINRTFDLMLAFQNNLNEAQRKKLTQMISHWVRRWD